MPEPIVQLHYALARSRKVLAALAAVKPTGWSAFFYRPTWVEKMDRQRYEARAALPIIDRALTETGYRDGGRGHVSNAAMAAEDEAVGRWCFTCFRHQPMHATGTTRAFSYEHGDRSADCSVCGRTFGDYA